MVNDDKGDTQKTETLFPLPNPEVKSRRQQNRKDVATASRLQTKGQEAPGQLRLNLEEETEEPFR